MLNEQTSHYVEVIVRVVLPHQTFLQQEGKALGEAEQLDPFNANNAKTEQSYDLLIYTDSFFPSLKRSTERVIGQPEQLAGLPFFGVEEIAVRWNYYQEYLRALGKCEEGASAMVKRERLFGPLSPGLQELFRGEDEKSPLRIWWDSTTLGLMDIPWEVLVYSGEPRKDISFVRGVPPEVPIPKTPVGQRLRLAFIHHPSETPSAVRDALKNLPGFDVVEMTDPPLQALWKAIRDGFELIHLVSDGSVSLAYEGFLYLRKPRLVDISSASESAVGRFLLRQLVRFYTYTKAYLPLYISFVLSGLLYKKVDAQTLTAAQLSSLLRGSRLAVLSLSAPRNLSADTGVTSDSVPTPVYRAFAYLAGSRLPLPSIVAQIGPFDHEKELMFWRHFYQGLAETKAVERAMAAGMSDETLMPVALFLRQRQAQTFEEREAFQASNLSLISEELQQSQRTLRLLRAAKRRHESLASIVDEFEQRETVRQERLMAQLRPWLEGSEQA
jgi:hypothetical protein